MSSVEPTRLDFRPLVSIVDRLHRSLQADMVEDVRRRGHPEFKGSHSLVFAWLPESGARTADMAARAGITRQSMGEVVRDLVDLGIVEMTPDPDDGRAKLVKLTDYGRTITREGRQHIVELERRLAEEFGEEEYAMVRAVLERATEIVGLPPELSP